jgi:large conductance mechanosensitive channel
MKKFWDEFKAFALKGNVLDMAVGVIIGAAFKDIVTSLTDNVISPIIGLLFQTDFSSVVIALTPTVNLNIGSFISAVINFFLMALVLFFLVKGVAKLSEFGKRSSAPEAPKAKSSEELLAEILAELKVQNSETGAHV